MMKYVKLGIILDYIYARSLYFLVNFALNLVINHFCLDY